jgi:transcriptional regulator with XRE-family HTH domain
MLSPLRKERILRGFTLYDIRAKANINCSKLSLAERGLEKLNEDEKRRLARALQVRIEDLFPEGSKESDGPAEAQCFA